MVSVGKWKYFAFDN